MAEAEFGKNGRISAWPKPKPKFGATLVVLYMLAMRAADEQVIWPYLQISGHNGDDLFHLRATKNLQMDLYESDGHHSEHRI